MDWKLSLTGASMPLGDGTARGCIQCRGYKTSLLQTVLDISIISDLQRAILRRGTTVSTTAHGTWWSLIVSARRRQLYLEVAQRPRPRGNGFKQIWPPTRLRAQ